MKKAGIFYCKYFLKLLKYISKQADKYINRGSMTNIDKTTNVENKIPIPKKSSENKKSNEAANIWGYKPPLLTDIFPDFKKSTISEEAKNIKKEWVKVIPDFSDEFAQLIVESSQEIKCSPEDLAALLFKESRFNPKASCGSFKGIGQMNSRSLRIAIDYALKNQNVNVDFMMSMKKFKTLSREEQLPYVRNYLLAMKDLAKIPKESHIDAGHLYGLVYTPSNVKKKVLACESSPDTSRYYKANKGLDYDGDGKITKEDLKNVIEDVKKIPKKIPDKTQSLIFRTETQA